MQGMQGFNEVIPGSFLELGNSNISVSCVQHLGLKALNQNYFTGQREYEWTRIAFAQYSEGNSSSLRSPHQRNRVVNVHLFGDFVVDFPDMVTCLYSSLKSGSI